MPVITLGDFNDARVKALLTRHLAGMHAHSPPGHVFALDWSALQRPEISFYTLWDGEELLGCGALKELDPRAGEIKSMRTADAHVRKGVGTAILEHIIGEARRRGYSQLSLETGSGPAFTPALSLYRKYGFVDGDAFGNYQTSSFNQFLHLALDAAHAREATQAHVRQASPSDIQTIVAILSEAAAWLQQRGMGMWRTNELAAERIADDVTHGLFYVAEVGAPVGTIKFQLADTEFWPDVPGGDSAFVHRLAVRRAFAGKGISTALLTWAAQQAVASGRRFLRLDCEASRTTLRAVYERFGFRHHSDRQVGPYFVSRYELDLHAAGDRRNTAHDC